METILVEKQIDTPMITFDESTTVLRLEGESYPEDPLKFYKNVLSWLEHYFSNGDNQILVRFKLSYINTSSLRMISNILYKLDHYLQKGWKIQAEWLYHPEDEMGLEYYKFLQEDRRIPFRAVAMQEGEGAWHEL